MAKIITKNSFTSGSSPSGLSAGELAVNVTDKKIFVGNAVQSAITLYDGNSIVSSINGTTGANYIVGGRGVTLIKSGNTYYPEIFYNSPGPTGLTFATITKVQTTDKLLIQQAGAGTQMKLIEVSKLINSPVFSDVGTIPSGLGAYDFAFFDGIYEPYKASGTTVRSYLFGDGVVTSVNGATGAITNVAKTNIGQTFISDTPNAFNKLNYFGGDSASIKFLAADVSNSNFWYSELRGNSNATTNTTHTLPATTGTLLNTNFNSYVSSLNGLTGGVTLAAGSNITLTPSGNTITIASSGGGGGGGSGFTYSSSAPGTPSLGDRWMDSDTGKEYVYVNDGSSSQWVEPVSSNGLVGVTYTPSQNLLQFGATLGFSGGVISDTGYRISSNAINVQTGTSYSLLSSDNGKIITMSNASTITLTVPSGLPIGFNTTVIQIGSGQVGITSSGVTLNSFESKYNLAGQHAAASIISYTTNVFNVAGGLTG
jgi:hypothetical protein